MRLKGVRRNTKKLMTGADITEKVSAVFTASSFGDISPKKSNTRVISTEEIILPFAVPNFCIKNSVAVTVASTFTKRFTRIIVIRSFLGLSKRYIRNVFFLFFVSLLSLNLFKEKKAVSLPEKYPDISIRIATKKRLR
jgi:hypothetical protein